MKNIALIFAGGVGKRMNSRAKPKQFLEIHGKPIILHTIEVFERHPQIDGICVVCVADWLDELRRLLRQFNISKVRWTVPGGESAMASQYNGLIVVKKDVDEPCVVLIHDGVRPLINDALITNCIESVKKKGSAVTVTPATETIVRVNAEGAIEVTYPRADCQLARAPQCFFLNDILEAHERARSQGRYDFVDSTSMMLFFGKQVFCLEGPSENIKVTNPSDFYICRALLDAKESSQIFGL